MLYLDSVSPQRIYQGIQKYIVIVLMKLSCSSPNDKLLTNIIFIVFWSKICMVSI